MSDTHWDEADPLATLERVERELAEARKQRDTMADVLSDIKDICMDKTITLHPDDNCKGAIDECLELTVNALAAVKGGRGE